jgi:tetratricopeptide (TPR) repeat protein
MNYAGSGEAERARREALSCLERIDEAHDLQPHLTLRAAEILGDIAFESGRWDEAIAFQRRGLEVAETLEPAELYVMRPSLGLAAASLAAGRIDDAERLARSVLELAAKRPSPLFLEVGARQVLADAAFERGALVEAADRSRALEQTLETAPHPVRWTWDEARNQLRMGRALTGTGDSAVMPAASSAIWFPQPAKP